MCRLEHSLFVTAGWWTDLPKEQVPERNKLCTFFICSFAQILCSRNIPQKIAFKNVKAERFVVRHEAVLIKYSRRFGQGL